MNPPMPIRSRPAWILALTALLVAFAGPAAAQAPDLSTPVGLWKTFDDATGKPGGIVRLYTQDGRIYGKIEKSFRAGADARTCVECTDERRNQPIIGLVFLRAMQRDNDEYRGGDILDPDNGSVYRCKLQLEDGGRKLRVRGYIGISLFGRTQIWERVDGEQ
jgi:uncharacterized protein (DUF2147 family)